MRKLYRRISDLEAELKAADSDLVTLAAELAAALAEVSNREAELAKHQESEFHPDWSMLQATRGSLREHMVKLKRAQESLDFARELIQKAGYQQEWNDFHDEQHRKAVAALREREKKE